MVEAKVVDAIGNYERGQMLNYLKISGFRLGLILNQTPQVRMGTSRPRKRPCNATRIFLTLIRG
ncbi:MAG TPA: GxxExxY protein [Terriglobia bacterium]|nr:GxxExxY protein [Terriglobia bacterium]